MARRKKGEWFIFTVEGDGLFPVDMLRYDNCWPLSETEDSPGLAGDCNRERRRVVLITCSEASPTPGRWEKYGWRYIGDGELRHVTIHPTPLRRL